MSTRQEKPRPPASEANFDGLVGPTHNYAGLSPGNLAAAHNADQVSNPCEAALQGLAKMKTLQDLGLPQGILPPHERPNLTALRQLGYGGKERDILAKVYKEAPGLLAAVSSASSMWTANAATVSPSADSGDGRVHFTPANLCSNLHRSFEPETSGRILRAVFPGESFAHHQPLPATAAFGDEGAANHNRLCSAYGEPGLELFVYGRGEADAAEPQTFPARQNRAAGEAIARLHGLAAERTLHLQQSPGVIDQGVFHNDVIAVANRELLLYHQDAYVDALAMRSWILERWRGSTPPVLIAIRRDEVSVEDAVASYLFNSQIVCPPSGGMHLIVSGECRDNKAVWQQIQRLLQDPANPLQRVHVVELQQSMRNGGGPACLRLRVVLTAAEQTAVNPRCWISDERHAELCSWVKAHYRDRLVLADLSDTQFLDETRTALDRLTQILGLGSVYDFQR